MIAIRGVYDGKSFRALPGEVLPAVEGEVPVEILFVEEDQIQFSSKTQLRKVIEEMREARSKMAPLGCSIKELIEEGRDL